MDVKLTGLTIFIDNIYVHLYRTLSCYYLYNKYCNVMYMHETKERNKVISELKKMTYLHVDKSKQISLHFQLKIALWDTSSTFQSGLELEG